MKGEKKRAHFGTRTIAPIQGGGRLHEFNNVSARAGENVSAATRRAVESTTARTDSRATSGVDPVRSFASSSHPHKRFAIVGNPRYPCAMALIACSGPPPARVNSLIESRTRGSRIASGLLRTFKLCSLLFSTSAAVVDAVVIQSGCGQERGVSSSFFFPPLAPFFSLEEFPSSPSSRGGNPVLQRQRGQLIT